jgi:prophage regulatory protein
MSAQVFLRIHDVCRVTALPMSTIYEMAAKGAFPKQVRISPRLSAWIESEVVAWQRARIAERDGTASDAA